MKKYFLVDILVLGLLCSFLCESANATSFVPIPWDIISDTTTHNGVPYIVQTSMQTGNHEGPISVFDDPFGVQSIDSFSLSSYSSLSIEQIHLLQYASWAATTPDGVQFGTIKVTYTDNTQESVDLVIGQNTSEWAYDRPEIQPIFGSTKIPAAYSFSTHLDSCCQYDGHVFGISINTDSSKSLSSLELFLAPTAAGQSGSGFAKLDIAAVTLQPVPEPSSLLLFGSGLAGLIGWRWRKSQEG